MNAYYFKTADGRLTAILAENENDARAQVHGEITELANVKEDAAPVTYKYNDYEDFCDDIGILPN